jgi:hypothetical protein
LLNGPVIWLTGGTLRTEIFREDGTYLRQDLKPGWSEPATGAAVAAEKSNKKGFLNRNPSNMR